MGDGRRLTVRRRMAALAVVTGAALLAPAPGWSQTAASEALVEGRVALSTALSLNVVKESGDTDSNLLLNAPLRVGCMLGTHFELEAEVLLSYANDGFGSSWAASSPRARGEFYRRIKIPEEVVERPEGGLEGGYEAKHLAEPEHIREGLEV